MEVGEVDGGGDHIKDHTLTHHLTIHNLTTKDLPTHLAPPLTMDMILITMKRRRRKKRMIQITSINHNILNHQCTHQ